MLLHFCPGQSIAQLEENMPVSKLAAQFGSGAEKPANGVANSVLMGLRSGLINSP